MEILMNMGVFFLVGMFSAALIALIGLGIFSIVWICFFSRELKDILEGKF